MASKGLPILWEARSILWGRPILQDPELQMDLEYYGSTKEN